MNYRPLGRTGVLVSPLCLGAMNFGGPTSEADSITILNRALDGGINFIDTANVYNAGESERIVGKALKENGRRDQIVLATKVYGKMGDGPNDLGVSRYHILKACEDSLRRLQTDHIDLYQLHRPTLKCPSKKRWPPSPIWCGRARCATSAAPPPRVEGDGSALVSELRGFVRFVSRAAAVQPARPPHRKRAGAAVPGIWPGAAALVAAGDGHFGRALRRRLSAQSPIAFFKMTPARGHVSSGRRFNRESD
jgi:hypothetical protein